MYVSRVVVKNFRNLSSVDIPLQEGVTTVIGENNSGKTNLVQAIRLALDADLPAFRRQLSESDVYDRIVERHPFQVLVSLEFRGFEECVNASAFAAFLKVEEDLARLTYRFRPSKRVRDSIADGERDEGSLSLDDYRWEICGGGEVDPNELGWSDDYGQGFGVQQLGDYLVTFLHALRDAAADLGKSQRSPLRRLIQASGMPTGEKEALLETLRAANDQISGSAAIEQLGARLGEGLAETAGEAVRLGVSLGIASPTFSAIERSLRVLMSSDTHAKFELSQNGLGVNNLLYIATLLQYFQSRLLGGSVSGSLLLIEEPEAHLHPQLERVVFDSLRKDNVQVIVTSHSSHIASRSSLGSVVVLTPSEHAGVHAHVPRQNPHLEAGDQADLERYLDATKSALLFARHVILVEGPAEMYVLSPLSKSVKGVDLDRAGVAVVPIFGTHFSQFGKLFGPDGIRKRCAIVTDCDGDPNEVPRGLEEIENEFVKVFATPTTFEKALGIEGMLTPLRAVAEEFNARTLLRAIEGGDLAEVGERALACALRHSKGRFAQVLSRNLDSATEMPEYLSRAIDWVSP